MARVFHRLTNIDHEKLTGICSVCGPVPISNHYVKGGVPFYVCKRRMQERDKNRYEAGRTTPGSANYGVEKSPYEWKHRLTNVNLEAKTADCAACGANVNIDIYINSKGVLTKYCHPGRLEKSRIINARDAVKRKEDRIVRLISELDDVRKGFLASIKDIIDHKPKRNEW